MEPSKARASQPYGALHGVGAAPPAASSPARRQKRTKTLATPRSLMQTRLFVLSHTLSLT